MHYYPPKQATAGEDLTKGDVVTILEEGKEPYAWKCNSTRPQIMPTGICDRTAKKGEPVEVSPKMLFPKP